MRGSSLGYDSTTLFIPPGVAGNRTFLEKLPAKRNDSVTGRAEYACGSLRIKQGRSNESRREMLTITGSLSTYLHGNNFHSLNSEEYGTALEALSNELGFDCGECVVWRAEFAGTFTVNGKPSLYFPCFQARPGLHAKNMNSGVYLQNKSLVIHIYDKSDDHNANALRLEVRRNKALAKAMGRRWPERVLASDLRTPEFFQAFVHGWHRQISSVLVSPGELPELPEKLTRKTLAQLESQLCREYPKTRSKLQQIFESYEGESVNKNLRPELRRELYGPHTEPENRRLQELQTKIGALAAPFIPALEVL